MSLALYSNNYNSSSTTTLVTASNLRSVVGEVSVAVEANPSPDPNPQPQT